jgi:hypothetical protein
MATIEQLSSALIKADAAGNAADAKQLADAIRAMRTQTAAPAQPQYASAVPQLDVRGQLVRQDAMPGPRQPSPGLGDRILGVPEAALTMGSGAVAGAVAPFVAVGEEILQGRFGEGGPQTERRAAELASQFTYTPRTQTGAAITGAVGETLQGLGLEAIPVSQGLTAAALAPGAARQAITGYAREAGLADEALRSIPAVRQAQEARVAQSFARAPQIDAANLATEYGIKLNPAVSNPSRRTRAESVLVGDRDISSKFAAENAPVWTRETKKALGLPETETLNAEAFDRLKNAPDLTQAYDTVRKTPGFVADDATLAGLDELQAQALVGDIGGKAAAKINTKLAAIKEQLAEGVSGDVLLKSVKDLRTQATSIYNRGKPGKPLKPGDIQLAELNMAAADALEAMIEGNLSGKALSDFRAARTKYAQIYSAEAATNIATGQVDPLVFAKMVQDGKPLTGPMADLGRIAANFPDIAKPSAGADWLQRGATTLTRAGVPGTIGFALGNVPGAVIGAAVGEIGSRILASRMGTPGYQRRRAVPPDYRPQPTVNALRPVEPGQSNIVPFDPRNALVQPEAPGPNFVFGRPDADIQVGLPETAPLLPPPSPTSTLAALRAEEARRAGMSRAMGAEAEAAAAAAESTAPRAPTAGGMVFDLDPVTGRLRPAAGAAPAAMPVMSTISSAADKISKGQRFAMTADEMVAWDRTSVELAELVPGARTLTQKQIAERMMDRKWVEGAIQKAREKELAFEQIERQSRDAQMVQQARAARERLIETMEMLEDSLADVRPKERARVKGQGPKTRAAKNQLREIEVLNKLID